MVKNDFDVILVLVIGFIAILLVTYGGWKLSRGLNYKMGYKTMVENTIKHMVKPEALR